MCAALCEEQRLVLQATLADKVNRIQLVQAVAGCGKTTLLYAMIHHIVREMGLNVLYLTFNNAMAHSARDTLKDYGPAACASTMHAFVWRAIQEQLPACRLEPNIVEHHFESLYPTRQHHDFDKKLKETRCWVDYVRCNGIRAHDRATLADRLLLRLSDDLDHMDYDGMLYYASTTPDGLVYPKYSHILVDETQDLNGVQQCILANLLQRDPAARLILVGDSGQSIYGFRYVKQAIPSLLTMLRAQGHTVGLHNLNVCHRCPRQTIALVQQCLVPQIQARPDAPEGRVQALNTENMTTLHILVQATKGAAVVMRTNRQIVQYLAAVYRCAVPMPSIQWPACHVQQHVHACLLRCFDLQREEDMLDVLQLAEDHVINRKCLNAFRRHGESVVRVIGEELVRCDSIGDFLLFLLGAMSRSTADITVISAHGCKGLTFDKPVVVVDPSGYQTTTNNPDGLNLLYVALTRGRRELLVVSVGRAGRPSAIAKFTGYAVQNLHPDNAPQPL